MNTRLQLKQHSTLVQFTLSFAMVMLLCSAASSQTQITPNPNPSGNTITVNFDAMNSEDFVNNGLIDILTGFTLDNDFLPYYKGKITNNGTIDNAGNIEDGDIYNYGYIDNDGIIGQAELRLYNYNIIDSSGTLGWGSRVENSGTFNNFGTYQTDAGGTLNNSGTFNNSGNFSAYNAYNGGPLFNSGTFNNQVDGTIHYSGADCIIDNSGTLNNAGLIESVGEIKNSNTIEIISGGTIRNKSMVLIHMDDEGTWITFDNPGTISNNNLLRNDGLIENQSSIIDNSSTIENTAGGTILNTRQTASWDSVDYFGDPGIINNQAGGTFINNGTFDNTSGTFNNEGTYQGTGTFIGTLDTGTGTVAPGNSAGTMYVDGDYILGGTGMLEIEIGGFDASESDFLDITETAFLAGGTINFSFIDGYDIITDVGYGETMSLMFLETGVGIDSFASTVTYDFLGTPAGFIYDVYQLGDGLIFEATNTNVVPTPGAVLLGSIGIDCVSWLLKRRTT